MDRPRTSSRDHPKRTSDWRFHSVRVPHASVSTNASRAMSSRCSILARRPLTTSSPSRPLITVEVSTIGLYTWTPVVSSCGANPYVATPSRRFVTGARPSD